jgi:hypothetical protein
MLCRVCPCHRAVCNKLSFLLTKTVARRKKTASRHADCSLASAMDAFSVQGTNLILLSVSVRLNTYCWPTTHDMLPDRMKSFFTRYRRPFKLFFYLGIEITGTTHELKPFFFQMHGTQYCCTVARCEEESKPNYDSKLLYVLERESIS